MKLLTCFLVLFMLPLPAIGVGERLWHGPWSHIGLLKDRTGGELWVLTEVDGPICLDVDPRKRKDLHKLEIGKRYAFWEQPGPGGRQLVTAWDKKRGRSAGGIRGDNPCRKTQPQSPPAPRPSPVPAQESALVRSVGGDVLDALFELLVNALCEGRGR